MTDFDTGVRRILHQVAHWAENRWHAPAASGPGTRGDVVFALVQRLADLAADAEGQPRRPVPRLHDMVLPDQLRVMADDLTAATAARARPGQALPGSGPSTEAPAASGPSTEAAPEADAATDVRFLAAASRAVAETRDRLP